MFIMCYVIAFVMGIWNMFNSVVSGTLARRAEDVEGMKFVDFVLTRTTLEQFLIAIIFIFSCLIHAFMIYFAAKFLIWVLSKFKFIQKYTRK